MWHLISHELNVQFENFITAGLTIQSIISREMDGDNFVVMSSLDLSAAFDLVYFGLSVFLSPCISASLSVFLFGNFFSNNETKNYASVKSR